MLTFLGQVPEQALDNRVRVVSLGSNKTGLIVGERTLLVGASAEIIDEKFQITITGLLQGGFSDPRRASQSRCIPSRQLSFSPVPGDAVSPA